MLQKFLLFALRQRGHGIFDLSQRTHDGNCIRASAARQANRHPGEKTDVRDDERAAITTGQNGRCSVGAGLFESFPSSESRKLVSAQVTGRRRYSRTAANASATTLASIRVSMERCRVTA